MTNKTNQYTS